MRGLAQHLAEWFLRRQELQAARAQLPGRDQLAERAFHQARLLREVARQVAAPADELPAGHRAAVLLSLHRDIVYWSLVAGARGELEASRGLERIWQQTPHDELLAAAGSERNLEAVHALLGDMPPAASLATTDDDVARVRFFADVLYRRLEVPRRRVARVVAKRWIALTGAAVTAIALAFGIRALVKGPNLARRSQMKVSSALPSCAADFGCADLLFHTNQEDGPWVEFDLGASKKIHVIDVGNRPDCCEERAVPLIAEISTDRITWREIGRQDKDFSRWKLKFPPTTTRYVRLRVPRQTYFGFADVAIR
jgi:hypothetical protein